MGIFSVPIYSATLPDPIRALLDQIASKYRRRPCPGAPICDPGRQVDLVSRLARPVL